VIVSRCELGIFVQAFSCLRDVILLLGVITKLLSAVDISTEMGPFIMALQADCHMCLDRN